MALELQHSVLQHSQDDITFVHEQRMYAHSKVAQPGPNEIDDENGEVLFLSFFQKFE